MLKIILTFAVNKTLKVLGQLLKKREGNLVKKTNSVCIKAVVF